MQRNLEKITSNRKTQLTHEPSTVHIMQFGSAMCGTRRCCTSWGLGAALALGFPFAWSPILLNSFPMACISTHLLFQFRNYKMQKCMRSWSHFEAHKLCLDVFKQGVVCLRFFCFMKLNPRRRPKKVVVNSKPSCRHL